MAKISFCCDHWVIIGHHWLCPAHFYSSGTRKRWGKFITDRSRPGHNPSFFSTPSIRYRTLQTETARRRAVSFLMPSPSLTAVWYHLLSHNPIIPVSPNSYSYYTLLHIYIHRILTLLFLPLDFKPLCDSCYFNQSTHSHLVYTVCLLWNLYFTLIICELYCLWITCTSSVLIEVQERSSLRLLRYLTQ